MKTLILKLLKIILICGALLVGLALIFGLVLGLDLPWWVGLFVLVGLAGFVIGLVFLKKILQRRQERRFVQQVISDEASRAASLSEKDKERSRDLQARWKEAMDALRSSHLKKKGNPLYVLPWYLVIGESGSGKTTAIKSARLSSPFVEVNKTSGISGTRNCDWWFFEQAVIIDTAGRYAIPVDEGRDKDEWQKFLVQLARFRKREPLNGLVITVAADKLLSASMETLEGDGKSLRLRIDELMRVLGAKFPVYLLVTKCDLVQGMTNFCSGLPENALDQALGILNHELTPDIASYHERAMHSLVERLKDLRLQLLNEPFGTKGDPSLFLFPEEFERLESGLLAFMKGAFQENPYQETPILRGMFFSSGRQEGSPYSHFLKSLGLIGDRDVLPGTSKGMFLFDFFSKILPRDRSLFAPTLRAVQWNRLTRNLGLTSWVAILIALWGLLTFSFFKNIRTIREITDQFSSQPVLQGEMISDVLQMDRFRQTILQAQTRNRSWWVPRFGLNQSLEAVSRLKKGYDTQFREMLLTRLDKEMTDRMAGFSPDTPDETVGNHLSHLVRRINLLKGKLAGDDIEALQNRPQPDYDVFSDASFPELEERFHRLYLYDLMWRDDRSGINREMTTLQTWLKHLLDINGTGLTFLVAWANANPDIAGVTLDEFWKGSPVPEEEPMIPPAYTLEGRKTIDRFISELEAALVDPLVFAGDKQNFQNRYRLSCLDAWQAFSENFPNGRLRLAGKADYQEVVNRIAAGQGPYFLYLDRVTRELAPYRSETDRGWIELAFRFEATRREAASTKTASKTGILSKADGKLQRLLSKTDADAPQSIADRFAAGTALAAYEDALSELSKNLTTRMGAFNAAAEAFKNAENPNLSSEEQPRFLAADEALRDLKTALPTGDRESDFLWDIIAGPQNLLWEFACNESACHLNEQWEDTVLIEIDGMKNREEINALVFGEKGLADKILDGEAAPFIDRSLRKGYYARTVLGRKIPFNGRFFTYLVDGEKAAKPAAAEIPAPSGYSVVIRAMPTDVNREARVKPHATRLELECGDTAVKLVNLNYPVKKTFEWSRDTCGDVVFSIEVGTLVLTRRYEGSSGFPEFLKDFGQGEKRLLPGDFPDHRRDLEKMGITYIQINYVFDGHSALLDGYRARLNALSKNASIPGVPGTIAQCWE